MKILLDENIANKIKEGLIRLGMKEIVHINDRNKGITDEEVFELAKKEDRIIITGDDDFKNNKYKYQIPIIWLTPNARNTKNIPELIKWILENVERYNINLKKAFITIRKDEYFIEYKNKEGLFGKIRTRQIKFDKVNKTFEKTKKQQLKKTR